PGDEHHPNASISEDAVKSLLALAQGLLSKPSFGDVLSGTSQDSDLSRRIALYFSAGPDPSIRTIRTYHTKIEFVWCPGSQSFLGGAFQALPAFTREESRMLFVAGGRPTGIPSCNSVEFLGPDYRVALEVPMPAANLSQPLRFQ